MAEHVVGIDLGTSNSCIASFTGKKSEVIRNALGDSLTPSVVAFGADGSLMVGAPARRQAVMNPKATFFEVKRLCGRRFDEKEVKLAQQILPYDIVKATNGDAWVAYEGKPISPPEIQAYILESLRKTAATYLGVDVRNAVITVPAFFDETQRQAVRDAATVAGMNALRILSEPTAAAIAFGQGQFNGRVVVIDFGGGTLDVTLMDVKDGLFKVLSTDGDNLLGGADFDQAIAKNLAKIVLQQSGVDPLSDAVAKQRLVSEAEKIKMQLNSQDNVLVDLQYLLESKDGPVNLRTSVSKVDYYRWVNPLIERLTEPCESVIKKIGLKITDVDEVLLVGGMSRSPLVQHKTAQIFKRKPSQKVNPDEAIALGAAIAAAGFSGQSAKVNLIDVAPRSIGLAGANNVFVPLIKASQELPAATQKRFATTQDNQNVFNLVVLQGESLKASENRRVARVSIDSIPPGPRGSVQLDLNFAMNENGQLSVEAKTGTIELKAPIKPMSGLTRSQVENMAADGRLRRGEGLQKATAKSNMAPSDAELLGNFAIDFGAAISPEASEPVKFQAKAPVAVLATDPAPGPEVALKTSKSVQPASVMADSPKTTVDAKLDKPQNHSAKIGIAVFVVIALLVVGYVYIF